MISESRALFPRMTRRLDLDRRVHLLWLAFSLELIAIAIARLPHDLAFSSFAFADRGSWLTAQYLAAHGRAPGIDFGYPYGLLPLTIGRAWFGLFGLTPYAFHALIVLCEILSANAVARFAAALRLSAIGLILIFAAMPYAITSSYPSLAHAVEPVLLMHALAQQARGNRAGALALTTAGAFAKPSMSYVYGAMLLLFAIPSLFEREGNRAGVNVRAVLRLVAPAVVTAIVLGALLGALFGPRTLITTLLPLSGLNSYHALGFGFFTGNGRNFWYTPGIHFVGFLATVVGFWFAATAFLIVVGIWVLWQVLTLGAGDYALDPVYEIVLTCIILHVIFVVMFFGGPTSWANYCYLLVLGGAAAFTLARVFAGAGFALIVLALLSHFGIALATRKAWRDRSPAPVTAGLWATDAELSEWSQVLRLIAGSRATVLSVHGGAAIMFPELVVPDSPWLVPGLSKPPREANLAVRRLASVSMVVAPLDPYYGETPEYFPQLARELSRLTIAWKGKVFVVYRNPAPTAAAP